LVNLLISLIRCLSFDNVTGWHVSDTVIMSKLITCSLPVQSLDLWTTDYCCFVGDFTMVSCDVLVIRWRYATGVMGQLNRQINGESFDESFTAIYYGRPM